MVQGFNEPGGFKEGKTINLRTVNGRHEMKTQETKLRKDSSGNSIWTVCTYTDIDCDGTNDKTEKTTYTFDKDGKFIHKKYENLQGGKKQRKEGLKNPNDLNSTEVTTVEYDEAGNKTKEKRVIDMRNDGKTDGEETITYKYDADGNITEEKKVYNVRGIEGSITTETHTYKDGKIVRSFEQRRLPLEDGWHDAQITIDYDENQHQRRVVTEYDTNGDGNFDRKETYDRDKYGYDSILIQRDMNHNGIYDERGDENVIRTRIQEE